MARKPEEEEYPAFIDYASTSPSTGGSSYTATEFKDHWRLQLSKQHKVGGKLWSLKEASLLKKLMQEFDGEVIMEMIEEWMKKDIEYAPNFGLFYKNRYVLHQRVQPKDYEW